MMVNDAYSDDGELFIIPYGCCLRFPEVTDEVLKEMKAWCRQNLSGPWHVVHRGAGFSNSDAAILFKMTWM